MTPTPPTPESEIPPAVVATWVWVKRRWPLIALSAFVVLGTIAFVLMRGLISDIQDTQKQGRLLVCAISNAVTANPIVRIPEFQTQEQFDRQVAALKLIVVQTRDIDCEAVLAPIIAEQQRDKQQQKGGGAHNPQTTGPQLPGGARPPRAVLIPVAGCQYRRDCRIRIRGLMTAGAADHPRPLAAGR